jgi:ATP-dependent Clp protease protease subunit
MILINEKDIYSKLFEERIIFLSEEIRPDNANEIKAQLLYLDQISEDPIKFYIDSPGGEIYTGLGIIDTMNYVSSPIETVNVGLAASMAAVILACGDDRKSLKHSRTMIHQPLGGDWGQSSDVEITAKELSKIKKELYKILSEKTGKDLNQIEIDADRDYWMDAKEAKKYGLIDKIIK